jgi:hypothetical protein
MLNILLAGVTASVMSRNRSGQSPVAGVNSSMGLAPSSCFHARQPSAANGSKQSRNAPAFVHLLARILFTI